MDLVTWPPLGKPAKTGKILVWQCSFGSDGVFHTTSGNLDGTRKYNTRQIVMNKSGRSLYEQCMTESRSAWRNQWKKGYGLLQTLNAEAASSEPAPSADVLAEVEAVVAEMGPKQLVIGGTVFEPMLAETYHDVMAKKPRDGPVQWPLLAQAKLDGVRMVALVANNQLECRSRQLGQFNHLTALKHELAYFMALLPPGTLVDGELYSHVIKFREILSRVRQEHVAHPLEHEIQYWLFDIYVPQHATAGTETRYNWLVEAYNSRPGGWYFLRVVPLDVAQSVDYVEPLHDHYVKQGYEGLILRHSEQISPVRAMYKQDRSINLIKHKHFDEEEGVIIGAHEGVGNHAGLVIWEVRSPDGQLLNVVPMGTFDERARYLAAALTFIGKKLTYRFQAGSDYDKARFPIGKAIRDYEPEPAPAPTPTPAQ